VAFTDVLAITFVYRNISSAYCASKTRNVFQLFSGENSVTYKWHSFLRFFPWT